jgi:hypothetical protein
MADGFLSDRDIDDCVAMAARVAERYVGVPEEEMLVDLYRLRAIVQAEVAETFGPDVAVVVAQAFVSAVAGHRRELEAEGATTRVLN